MHTFKYTLLLASVLFATSAFAPELPYTFRTLDIKAPGQEWDIADMVDINDHGEILASSPFGENGIDGYRAIISNGKKYGKLRVHFCGEIIDGLNPETKAITTKGFSINNDGEIAGYCSAGDAGPFLPRVSGFVLNKNGSLMLLDFPGAHATIAQGISTSGGFVTGKFWAPWEPEPRNRQHCFLWDRTTGEYTQIDFPKENSVTDCFAVNTHGQVLGEYYVRDNVNGETEHGFFIYDNGNFTVPFPLFEGGPSWYAYDMNDDGAIIGVSNANDGTGDKVFLYDDGVIFDVPLPEGWKIIELGGMNNKGEFVGRYEKKTGIEPYCYEYYQDEDYCGIYEWHGFVGIPRR